MIEKEYGKYVGVCDICGETSPRFDTWDECRTWVSEHWKTTRDEDTGEWVNLCTECQNI